MECKEFDEKGQCKIISIKELKKYGRMDAEFYVRIKPDVESFFNKHITTTDGRIIESKMAGGSKSSEFLKHFTGKDVQLLWMLIKEHEKFDETKNIILSSLLPMTRRINPDG